MTRILIRYVIAGMPRLEIPVQRTTKAARKYNRTRKPPPFQVGDHVWLRHFPISKANRHFAAKLSPRYKGPYILAEFTTPVSVKLIDAAAGNTTRAHVSQLKLA
jgi:hypothetical protein